MVTSRHAIGMFVGQAIWKNPCAIREFLQVFGTVCFILCGYAQFAFLNRLLSFPPVVYIGNLVGWDRLDAPSLECKLTSKWLVTGVMNGIFFMVILGFITWQFMVAPRNYR